MFNGSTALRNAAGQMIDEVVKDAHNGVIFDDAYFRDLSAEMTSLYRLDQIQTNGSWKQELGPLPRLSVLLLGGLGTVWVCMALIAVKKWRRGNKK